MHVQATVDKYFAQIYFGLPSQVFVQEWSPCFNKVNCYADDCMHHDTVISNFLPSLLDWCFPYSQKM